MPPSLVGTDFEYPRSGRRLSILAVTPASCDVGHLPKHLTPHPTKPMLTCSSSQVHPIPYSLHCSSLVGFDTSQATRTTAGIRLIARQAHPARNFLSRESPSRHVTDRAISHTYCPRPKPILDASSPTHGLTGAARGRPDAAICPDGVLT